MKFLSLRDNIKNTQQEEKILDWMKVKKSGFWKKAGEGQSLRVFNDAVKTVPAYKKFLKENHIKSNNVRTYNDFKNLPAIHKENYLRKNDFANLLSNKNFRKNLVFTSTSGSTGTPFYFPRNFTVDWQSSIYHELFLRNAKIQKKQGTLVIVCFGMGVWIGGIITYEAFRRIADRGYAITLVTPGVNKKEILDALSNIGHHFDNVIICGYPPFLKDVLEEAEISGINIKSLNLKIIFAAESFSESFRDHIAKLCGIKNILRDIVNIYGSADLGTMAKETPLSILVRRIALQKSEIFGELFGDLHRTPTLAQFNPLFVNFEERDSKILCTGENALPLVKYDIGDHGGVFYFSDLLKVLKKHKVNIFKEAKKEGIDHALNELPFVYVYERADFSVKLYGAIIYPEHVRMALHSEVEKKKVTGKFVLETKTDKKHNQFLEVNVELFQNVSKTKALEETIKKSIINTLLDKNSEYKNNHNFLKEKVEPVIVFWPYGNETYFRQGTKQKWVKKS
jgi:phenylacetate-CoA ligase